MKWRLKEQYKGFLQERVGSLKKITKPMEMKEREKTQMNKVRDKRRDINNKYH